MRLQKLTEGWFPIPKDPDETEFHIKHLRSGEIKKITTATQKRRFEFREEMAEEGKKPKKKGKKQEPKLVPVPIVEMDQVSAQEMEILESIIGWKNVYDSAGEIMQYSAKNKLRFSKELSVKDYTDWIAFIDDKRKVLADQIAEDEETAKGN